MISKPALNLFAIILIIAQSAIVSCQPTSDSNYDIQNRSAGELYSKYDLDKIQLPAGFKISVFAEAPEARSLCLGERGTIFVSTRDGGKVYALKDENKDGLAEKIYTIAKDLRSPNGIAFRNGSLFIAEISRIIRLDDIESRLSDPPKKVIVFDKFPTDKHHGWKFIAFGPDGKLYVPVGAPCNVCEKDDSLYSTITRMDADGTNLEVYAKGVRNTVGFAWHPDTKELWFTDNGRDNLGDDIPADELDIAPRKGLHFGFPYCHQGDIPDPHFGKGKDCKDYIPPALKLGPHVAGLGMRFYTGDKFPPEYKNQVFIAEHGSWNRSTPTGYRVMLVKIENNKPTQYIPFATGWLQNNNKVTGRPVDVLVLPDGSLLVSDDKRGAVYRISYGS